MPTYASSIPSAESFGEPIIREHVAFAQSIPSAESFGEPIIREHVAFAQSIPSAESWGRHLSFPSYLSRPVLSQAKNWATAPAKQFSYNLDEVLLGYSSPRFQRVQSQTIRGLEFSALLASAAQIDAFEQFVERCEGRLNGFWIESPFEEFEIIDGDDADSFVIRAQGLAASWEDHTCRHLVFTKGTGKQFAKITTVEAAGEEETVTVQGLTSAIDETWTARKALYVRFAADDEDQEFLTDNKQTRALRVVELPNEYEEAETGQRPVFLYELWFETDAAHQSWYFTGLNRNIRSNGTEFTTMPIAHKGHTRSIKADQDKLTLETVYETGNPLTQFFPFTLPKPLWVKVYETTYPLPDNRTLLFTGLIEEMALDGLVITAPCSSLLDVLGRRFPRFFIQNRCNYFLFATPCGLAKISPFKRTGEVSLQSGRYLKLTVPALLDLANQPVTEDWFALGWVEIGTGATFELRAIDHSTVVSGGSIQLTLNSAFTLSHTGQTATFYAGCNGARVTCDVKFDNFQRWGGHNIAPQNLSVQAVPAEYANGNKK